MDRLIEPAHPIHDLHRRRWSPRAFDPHRAVEPEKLRSVMEAARWAPSSFNEQPWRFIVATREDPEQFNTILSCLMEGNQAWARHAPVLMIACAATHLARNGKPNRHALYDLGAAVAHLTLEATALGLYLHQMAGFYPDKAREAFAIPESVEPVSAIAMGYPGDPSALPEDLRRRELTPSTRKPITDFVFERQWGQPARWAQR